jgi:hypothetical protein
MASAEAFKKGAAFFGIEGGGLQFIRGFLTLYTTGVTAPCTSLASAGLVMTNTPTPRLELTLRQTAPLLAANAIVLRAYSTSGVGSNANAVVVARPNVPSRPITYPAGAIAGTWGAAGVVPAAPITGTGAAQDYACAAITADCVIRFSLVGFTGAVAAALAVPTVNSVTAGTGFNATLPALGIYTYEVLFA